MTALFHDGGFDEAAAEQTRPAAEFGLRQLLTGIQSTIEANRDRSTND